MNTIDPQFRCGTAKAIKELSIKFNYPCHKGMQDWAYEVANPKDIENYFSSYKEETDEDKKFVLMEMMLQALDEIENQEEFDKNWRILKPIINQDFYIHEYTIYYWCFWGYKESDCWEITLYIRELWKEIKNKCTTM
ncbi:hypothetical protein QJU23_03390 [Pasteurella atlantica]|uniref:Uncharacterized protein n=2 Tax=Pasteurellaceae TaxID=712 RepID=A0ACC6HL12_9PAST|nr:hypothetical protein [Pasteurella atlantica]MDP8051469.1 hypothetical protein [Pasteurella atlantica]MDP8104651.1 hypothetical protein [Pasteurella atlantica]MDP8148127.1 hypothetical protein [Pasteurella atlantica]